MKYTIVIEFKAQNRDHATKLVLWFATNPYIDNCTIEPIGNSKWLLQYEIEAKTETMAKDSAHEAVSLLYDKSEHKTMFTLKSLTQTG